MTCGNFEDLILDDLDGHLAETNRVALTRHLANCGACRTFLAAQVKLDLELSRSIRVEGPLPMNARRLLRLREPARSMAHLPLEMLWNYMGVLAVAVAGGIAAQWWLPLRTPGLAWAVGALLVGTGVAAVSESVSAYSD